MNREAEINLLILIGVAKMFTEQATFLTGELKRDTKYRFNLAVTASESLVSQIEKDLSDYNKKTLEILTDSLHDGIKDLRKELQEAK